MKTIFFLNFFFILTTTCLLYGQITITEIVKQKDTVVLKPEPYDSLKNFRVPKRYLDYKQYIGLQLYLPPMAKNIEKWKYSSRYKDNFLFSIIPSVIIADTTIKDGFGKKSFRKGDYDSIITFVYKPFQHGYFEGNFGSEPMIGSNGDEVGDKYYTVIDVLNEDEVNKKYNEMHKILWNKEREDKKFYGDWKSLKTSSNPPDLIFTLRNNSNGDTVYCYKFWSPFILVPYFVKLKQLYEGKNLIFDGGKHFPIYGKDITTDKEVIIEYLSKWLCKEVTLIKHKVPSGYSFPLYYEDGDYDICYLLKNEKNETIALLAKDEEGIPYKDFHFILEDKYLEQEKDKQLRQEELEAKRKKEEQLEKQTKIIEKEKHRQKCIEIFGQDNGELIAQGKVKIGMTKEMCSMAWGSPWSKDKTTTEYGVYESQYYFWGKSLHFENGILKRIEE